MLEGRSCCHCFHTNYCHIHIGCSDRTGHHSLAVAVVAADPSPGFELVEDIALDYTGREPGYRTDLEGIGHRNPAGNLVGTGCYTDQTFWLDLW